MILIDILDQGSKKKNEKSVLKKLNKGEFTIELDEEQDGIETLKKLFNKKSVIKYFEDALTSDLAPGIILSKFLNDLQNSVRDCCFNIYVEEWGRVNDDDDDDDSEYPNNINEDAFDETIRGHSGGYKTIVFEKLKS
jgi:phosphopantothenoylcysteine synthetase/decarboxylase